MADPIGIASGLIALATFALQSSKVLYQTVQSFKSNRKAIRELGEELEALDGVLQSLLQTLANSKIKLPNLELPVFRCGKACKDFEAIIIKCTTHSGGSRQSFRDWAKLQYMGDDIAGFKDMLAGYKSTISIALGDANIRTVAVTAEVLDQYKDMILNTTSDLEEHLQGIDEKLHDLSMRGPRVSHEDEAELQQIQEERDSAEQCLRICMEVAQHLDQVQPSALEEVRTASDTRQIAMEILGEYISAKRATGNTLKDCKDRLADTTLKLEQHLKEMNNRLEKFSKATSMRDEHYAEQQKIQDEKNSIEQCLGICAQAAEQADNVRTNIAEDISVAHDSHQVVVATLGDLISAKRVTAGARSAQWVGQMSDTSLQQLSRDRDHLFLENSVNSKGETGEGFQTRYGAGYNLNYGSPGEKGN